MAGHLELREELGGLRCYLAGKAIHAGAGLEILFAGDVWLEGRYEWTYKREDRPVLYDLKPSGPSTSFQIGSKAGTGFRAARAGPSDMARNHEATLSDGIIPRLAMLANATAGGGR